MKKILVILMMFLSFSIFSQAEDYFPDRVKLGTTPTSNAIDNLITIDADGVLNRSTVTLSNIGVGVFLPYNGATSDVSLGNHNLSAANLFAATGGVTAKTLNAQSDEPLIKINDTDVNGGNADIRLPATPSFLNIDLVLPSSSGTFALTNQVVDLTTNQIILGEKTFNENINLTSFIEKGSSTFIHNFEDVTTTGANTFVGLNSGNYTLSAGGGAVNLASSNAGFGYNSLNATTTGYDNTAVGAYTMQLNTTGFRNTALGVSALSKNTTGDHNLAVGQNALLENTTGIYNTALGIDALHDNVSGSWNLAIGQYSQLNNISGFNNVSVATSSLSANTTGSKNTALGISALMVQDGVDNNTAVGYETGKDNLSGTQITFVGNQAGRLNTTGSRNTYIGNQAGYSNLTGQNNTGVGHASLYSGTGSFNTALGYQSLNNTTGSNNVGVGTNALFNMVSGNHSVAVGYSAGLSMTSGNFNTFIGYTAGSNASQLTSAQNSMALGNASYTTKSNQIVLGNTLITEVLTSGQYNVRALHTAPLSAVDTGTTGEVRYTDDYIYICIATNTWKRAALVSW